MAAVEIDQLYLGCSRSARPLPSRLNRPCRSPQSLHCISAAPAALDRYPRGVTGHVARPSRSIHRLAESFVCSAQLTAGGGDVVALFCRAREGHRRSAHRRFLTNDFSKRGVYCLRVREHPGNIRLQNDHVRSLCIATCVFSVYPVREIVFVLNGFPARFARCFSHKICVLDGWLLLH